MRRYTSLLLTAFALFLIVLCGSAYLAGADDTKKQRPMREIVAYTTLPAAQVELLADEYEKRSRIRVNFMPLSQKDILERLRLREESHPNDTTIVLADRETLDKAAQEGAYSESASTYGVWDVPKTYLHRYGPEENWVTLDFDKPLASFGGATGFDVAESAFSKCVSQYGGKYVINRAGSPNDARQFGLFRSLVGEDTALDDLFEHIPTAP